MEALGDGTLGSALELTVYEKGECIVNNPVLLPFIQRGF